MKEEWKFIKGYENIYKISSHGRVESFYGKGMVRRTPLNKNGYCVIRLHKDKQAKNHAVHRLVAEAFIPNTKGKECVNHKDANKTNNKVDNLEWVSQLENIAHAVSMDLVNKGDCNPASILKEGEVLAICDLLDNTKLTQRVIAQQYKIHPVTVSHIHTGKIWNWLTNRSKL